MTFFVVTRIFDKMTPSIRADLTWKAQRGAVELANTADIGMAAGDLPLVTKAFADYTRNDDVLALAAIDPSGKPMATYGALPDPLAVLLSAPAGGLHEGPGYLAAWAPVEIEGTVLGKVVVVVSKARLEEGERLRHNILVIAGAAWPRGPRPQPGLCPLLHRSVDRLDAARAGQPACADREPRGSRLVAHPGAVGEQARAWKRMLERLTTAQRELMDTSRMAGMAEVATSVLHNVGNVLNSVNVSATLVTDTVRRSKGAGLGKAAQLIREHEGHLAEFFSTDERGKKLPAYLSMLAAGLEDERTRMLRDLHGLNENVNHIKIIINMQQSHAKTTGGVKELLVIKDLVEDALRFNLASYGKHGIDVAREYEDLPAINLDRHKLFQILMNLLSNARHAIKDLAGERHIRVRVVARDADTIAVEVSDNGVGIPAENLNKIFVHGFTTKKDGHGYGLHSSANAAKELGGALGVTSPGINRGATFTLVLPVGQVVAPVVSAAA